MIIAIDGPAGAGKTTVGKALAKHFRCRFINTGAMYRAVAWAFQQGFTLEEITLQVDEEGRVIVNGELLEEELYERKLDQLASEVSRRPEVRKQLISLQRELAHGSHVVMEGRDIGTIVLPDADVKLYIDADIGERAHRRLSERAGDSFEQILNELEERDRRDQGFGRLAPSADAIRLDTTGKTVEESFAAALQMVEKVLAAKQRSA
jgi:cytidylate kinase